MKRTMMVATADAGDPHRYWRILATDLSWYTNDGDYQTALYTIAMFASTDGTGTDLCLAGTASARSIFSATFDAAKANDNNPATWWSSQVADASSNPQWWAVDFGVGNDSEIHSLSLKYFVAQPYQAKSYDLQWSDDGAAWTTQTSINTSSSQNITELFTDL